MNKNIETNWNKKPLITIWFTTALMLLNLNANANEWQNKINEVALSTQINANLVLKHNSQPEEDISDWIKLTKSEFKYINDWTFPNWKNVDMWNAFWFELNTDSTYKWNNYKSELHYNAFLNNWESRTEAKNRIDEVSFNIQRQIYNSWVSIGWGFQTFWNYWWKSIQNWIHSIVWDTQIENAEYWDNFLTPTINASHNKSFEIWKWFNLDIETEWAFPIIPNNWITNINAEWVINKDVIWIDLWIWVWVWYNRYPDQKAFNWYPLNEENWAYSYWTIKASKEIYWIDTSLELKVPLSWWITETTNNSSLIIWLTKKF